MLYVRVWTGEEWLAPEIIDDTGRGRWPAVGITSRNQGAVIWTQIEGSSTLPRARTTDLKFNSRPVVGKIGVSASSVALIATPVEVNAPFTDVGLTDTHSAVWNWGDGTTSPGTVTESNGSGTVKGTHAYAAAGIYPLTLTVADQTGAQGQSTFEYVVTFDPSGGFVTGGGWIDSPVGACQLTSACAASTGKANFGLVAKYQKRAIVPTGQVEFDAANLSFKGAAYDWLVVGNGRAQAQGSGTIAGVEGYGFVLTAVDGRASGGTDKFRMRIWEKATGRVVYDNQMGAKETLAPVTAVGGGSVVIHKD